MVEQEETEKGKTTDQLKLTQTTLPSFDRFLNQYRRTDRQPKFRTPSRQRDGQNDATGATSAKAEIGNDGATQRAVGSRVTLPKDVQMGAIEQLEWTGTETVNRRDQRR